MYRLAVVALILASSSLASAGTYVGLGIGTAASGSAERGGATSTMDGIERSGRLLLGTRLSRLSVEGQGSRYDVTFDANGYQSTQLGIGLKFSLPLGNNFEAFGRGGVSRTWLNEGPTAMHDAAGSGYFLGAGFEYRLTLGVTAASLFVDYQRSSTDFTNDYMVQWNGTASMWTFGATVSL